MLKTDSQISHEDVSSLQARIAEHISDIDLSTDIDPVTRGDIEFGELSGSSMSDYGKKLLVLVERKVITSDECSRLIIASIGE